MTSKQRYPAKVGRENFYIEDLEKRFGSNLRLSEKERVGIRIAEDETIDMMKGSQWWLGF